MIPAGLELINKVLMIIGIGGNHGSENDVVAKILQYFTLPKEIRTVGIDEWIHELSYHPSISENISTYLENRKFSEKLKKCVALLTGVQIEKLNSVAYNNTLLPECWNSWALEYDMGSSIHRTKAEAVIVANYLKLPKGSYTIEKVAMTFKEAVDMLKDAGTDVMHPNVWVNALFQEYHPVATTNIAKFETARRGTKKANIKISKEPSWPSWVISDVSSMNEIDAIKNDPESNRDIANDFRFLIKVNCHRSGDVDNGPAPTETEIEFDDYHAWDYVIEYDDNLDNLAFEIHDMLKSKKEFERYFHI